MDNKGIVYQLPNFTEVTPSEHLLQLFVEARTNIALGSPIYAYVMMRCEYIFTRDIPLGASCVHDDRNIVYLNPDDFEHAFVNRKQRAFLVMHELDHIFFMHQQRGIDMCYDHELFNQACDFYINLHKHGVYLNEHGNRAESKKYKDYFEFPGFGLLDERFLGMGADEIYEILKKEQQSGGGGNGSGGQPGGSGGNFAIDMLGNGGSKHQVQKNVQTMQAAVTFAQKSNSIGDCEGHLSLLVRDMATPVIPWTDQLMALLQTAVKIRPTYNRLSRRSSTDRAGGVVFPTYTGNKLNLVFGVDSSGSMGQSDYAHAVGELYGLISQFEAWTVHFVCCDMALTELGTYSSEDYHTIDDFNLEFRGLGGTDMSPIVAHASDLMDNGEEINAVIIITDGDIGTQPLDSMFSREVQNIVVTTRNHKLELSNARVIAVN